MNQVGIESFVSLVRDNHGVVWMSLLHIEENTDGGKLLIPHGPMSELQNNSSEMLI